MRTKFAAAPSLEPESLIFTQYTAATLDAVNWGDAPGDAAASTPAEHPEPNGWPIPIGKSASDGTDAPVMLMSVSATGPDFDMEKA